MKGYWRLVREYSPSLDVRAARPDRDTTGFPS